MSEAKIPLALQLYSVRNDCAKDLPAVLKAVAEMGYVGVEFAGFYDYSAADMKKLLDDNGLAVAGSHTGFALLDDDKLNETIEYNLAIGNKYIIVPWLGEECYDTRENWEKTADKLNTINDKVKALGARFGYHNHSFEFKKFDDEYLWDIFFSRLSEDIIMQLDSGNALNGGAPIAPFIKNYPGRATTVHLKEHSLAGKEVNIGEGDVPWDEIFDLCESVGGTEWYIVEQEKYSVSPMECVKICLDNLKKMGK